MTEHGSLVTVTTGGGLPPGQLWRPSEGDEVASLLSRQTALEAHERSNLVRESLEILGRCTDPGRRDPARRAGLVVGAVQSGKTLSFTTVMALARDNGFQLVVLVAGTKENLLEQSRDRLADDLGLDCGDAHYRWAHHKSPRPQKADVHRIAEDLSHALEQADEEEVPTVLITVMKNHTHMANAAEVLRSVAARLNLGEVSALVIDDEADQATPNLSRQGESATYRNLREIRDALPRHTLLQYTATPQAPLLVSLADEISPDFTWVLLPGEGYTGGQFFFEEHRDWFFEPIPAADLNCLEDPTNGPPPSLLRAVATFFVGAAAAQAVPADQRPHQRSMLVHPSQATLPHADFHRWIDAARRAWGGVLRECGPDREDLIEDMLRPAFDNLALTVPDIPSWEAVLRRLPSVLGRARIEQVNARAGRSPEIDWSQAYAWVLVGGALMDRGFTVEGLTVTYMPRGAGVGNADTLQQRARFFGYKRRYAGYCRAWLETEVADLFTSYVRHEEVMRRELDNVARAGQPLRTWRRRFLLDADLRPTRQATVRLPMGRVSFDTDEWIQQRHAPLTSAVDDIVAQNQETVERFANGLSLVLDREVSGRTPPTQHERADVELGTAYEDLLVGMRMVEEDQPTFLGLLLSLEDYISRNADVRCVIYRMSQGRTRRRSLAHGSATRISSLLQGEHESYLGDRFVRDEGAITIQLHYVDVTPDTRSSNVLRGSVPFVAIKVPRDVQLDPALVQL